LLFSGGLRIQNNVSGDQQTYHVPLQILESAFLHQVTVRQLARERYILDMSEAQRRPQKTWKLAKCANKGNKCSGNLLTTHSSGTLELPATKLKKFVHPEVFRYYSTLQKSSHLQLLEAAGCEAKAGPINLTPGSSFLSQIMLTTSWSLGFSCLNQESGSPRTSIDDMFDPTFEDTVPVGHSRKW
jgi:hypothetical protein